MKRISFLVLVALMVFTVGNAFGWGLSLTNVDGLYATDTIPTGTAITFEITWDQTGAGFDVTGSSNGYRVYSPDGSVDPVTSGVWDPGTDWSVGYDGGTFVVVQDAGPSTDDTVGFGGFRLFGPGILDGFVGAAHLITLAPFADADDGGTVCLDSSQYLPNPWLWSTTAGSQYPSFSGPHCYTIYKVPHIFPTISNDPGSVTGSHCGAITYDFDMQVNDPDNPAPPQTFVKVSGEGTINATTGEWSFAPNQGNVGQALSVEVQACDAIGCGPSVTVSINVTNIGPSITCGGDVAVGKGNTVVAPIASASDGDCDAISFFDGGVSPSPTGSYSVDAGTGTLTFNTDVSDCPTTFAFTIGVTDGVDTAYCTQNVDVLCTEPFEVQIEKTHGTYQGGHEIVDVTINKGSEEMRGFDILIGYDPSALSLQAALEGDPYSVCGWEYFNWRYGPAGNCSNACPSGKVRVVGIADMNNGPNHPSCFNVAPMPYTLFSLDFLVTDNRLFECQYVPIRFWWLDCGDNSIAYNPESDPTNQVIEQGISRYVIDFDLIGHIEDGSVGFPTYMGAQDDCLNTEPNKPSAVRFVDFLNGGIDIVCADSIDARGDLNLNGTANEIADGVLFTNYFIYGLGVFQVNVQGQIAASDVNNDGITLSVADLVTLIRIIVGDQNGTPKIAPVNATLTSVGGVYSVDSRMGAAYLEVEGNVAPQLLANDMEMQYNFDGNTTRIIVSSIIGNSFEGSFIDVGNATVTNFELATDEGAPVAATAKIVPTSFSLAQNYPNPFNPRTTVAFNLAQASDWTLSIYNITGQKVAEFSGTNEAGEHAVSWDAAAIASGIYFYKLNAGDFSETKKMVLLK